jgi:hypothetical protein
VYLSRLQPRSSGCPLLLRRHVATSCASAITRFSFHAAGDAHVAIASFALRAVDISTSIYAGMCVDGLMLVLTYTQKTCLEIIASAVLI